MHILDSFVNVISHYLCSIYLSSIFLAINKSLQYEPNALYFYPMESGWSGWYDASFFPFHFPDLKYTSTATTITAAAATASTAAANITTMVSSTTAITTTTSTTATIKLEKLSPLYPSGSFTHSVHTYWGPTIWKSPC